jgi:hypothetical protein
MDIETYQDRVYDALKRNHARSEEELSKYTAAIGSLVSHGHMKGAHPEAAAHWIDQQITKGEL